jgi:hypothetical protein
MHKTAAESFEGSFKLLKRKDFGFFILSEEYFIKSLLLADFLSNVTCYVSGLDALSEGARLHRRLHATHSCGPPTGTAATPSSSAHPTAPAGTTTTTESPCSTPAA